MLYMLLIYGSEADYARIPDALFGSIDIRLIMQL